MSIKIDLPDHEAYRLLDEYEQSLLELEGRAAELKQTIASIKAQLDSKLPGSPKDEQIGKRKKGSNYRAIYAFVKGVGVSGATVAEISKSAHIPISSCTYQLKQHPEIFAKANDGLWRLKPNAWGE